MAVSAEFKKMLKKSKEARKRFTESKKARPGEFTAPDIPEGNYVVRVSTNAKATESGSLLVALHWTIVKGEYKDKNYDVTYFLTGDDPEKVQKQWDSLSKAVQVLADISPEDLDSFAEWGIEELCEILEKIDEDAPVCRARIKPWKGDKSSGLNCFFNELLDKESLEDEESKEDEEPEEPEEEEEEPEEEENMEEESEEEESEEEEEGEKITVAKDDFVWYKPPRFRNELECQVALVSAKKRTASLQEVEGERKWTAVSWDELEIVEYEDE